MSLFQRKSRPDAGAPTPYELIEQEVGHLKKGKSVRHGSTGRPRVTSWLLVAVFCGLGWLYLMDPILHAWYKDEAIRLYLYLHNYGSGPLVGELVATGLFSADEIDALNHQAGSFQDYYASPAVANERAEVIIKYMAGVRLLHDGKYQKLNRIGRVRYYLFIRPGIILPTDWSFVDPHVSS